MSIGPEETPQEDIFANVRDCQGVGLDSLLGSPDFIEAVAKRPHDVAMILAASNRLDEVVALAVRDSEYCGVSQESVIEMVLMGLSAAAVLKARRTKFPTLQRLLGRTVNGSLVYKPGNADPFR